MNKLLHFFTAEYLIHVQRVQLYVLSLKKIFSRSGQVTQKEQIILFKRLAMMLQAGLPIVTSLEMIAEGVSRAPLSKILRRVIADVSSGHALGLSLRTHDTGFSFFSVSIVSVGEQSGSLPQNLEYLATELQKKRELKKQIIGALLYPIIVIVITLAITLFLVLYIFPKIIPIFLSVTTTLPWSTRFLMWLSNGLMTYGVFIITILFLLVALIILALKLPRPRYTMITALLKMPVVGKLSCYYNLAQLARTLGLLLLSDVPLVRGLGIAAESTSNSVYRKALLSVQEAVSTGKNLAAELQKTPQIFPTLVVQMVQAGETTGNMPDALMYISELYEGEIKDITKNLTTIIEPILMLVMGLIVGFIAISIITPIYGITQNLHP